MDDLTMKIGDDGESGRNRRFLFLAHEEGQYGSTENKKMNPAPKHTPNAARFSWRPRKSSSTAERLGRVLHVAVGLALSCASLWAADYIDSPYQVIYIVTLGAGLLLVGTGLYARRETIFKAFLGYWC